MDRQLPDDIEQWPNNPFELLGVGFDADRRAVRRAYAALIRIYKPEQFPAQFRRIRDAYEIVEQRLKWTAGVGGEENRPGAPPPADESADDLAARQTRREELWREARAGSPEGAYAAMCQATHEGRADEETYARLFWMLRVARDLDPQRDPRDWLVAGMRQLGLRGRLPELYRCELADDPQEATGPRAEDVLACAGHPAWICEIVAERWRAARTRQRWELILADLASLRPRMHNDAPNWGRVLLMAIDQLAWAKTAEACEKLEACRQEIEQVAEHWLPIAGELDRRDMLIDLVKACDEVAVLPILPRDWRQALHELLCDSWYADFAALRRPLIDLTLPLVQNPLLGLEWLDKLDARCRPALHQLGNVIVAWANVAGVGQNAAPPEVVGPRLIDFLVRAARGKYPQRWRRWLRPENVRERSGRTELLIFCVEEGITVRQLADMLARSPRSDFQQLLAPASSAALHILCLAYQAFWA